MKHVRSHIDKRQAEFAGTKFFEQLEENRSPANALTFVRGLAFFVMAFQDILRLNAANVQTPKLRTIARHHAAEDRGHDLWFLDDVAQIDGTIPDAEELFSPADIATRDTVYQLMSEVFRATDDRVRIVLLLVLEATGHIFFRRIVGHLESIGYDRELRYFGRAHLDVELNHALFEEQLNTWLDEIVMSETDRAVAIATADRCFVAMTNMMEALSARQASMAPVSVAPASTVHISRRARNSERVRQVG
jgi:hypothetical protein